MAGRTSDLTPPLKNNLVSHLWNRNRNLGQRKIRFEYSATVFAKFNYCYYFKKKNVKQTFLKIMSLWFYDFDY